MCQLATSGIFNSRAAVARAGDVDDVGRELPHGFDGGGAVTQELEVEEHVRVEAQQALAAGDLHGRMIALGPRARFGANVEAEEWITATRGKGVQLARGERDAVHFVEAVGKEGYAGSHPSSFASALN